MLQKTVEEELDRHSRMDSAAVKPDRADIERVHVVGPPRDPPTAVGEDGVVSTRPANEGFRTSRRSDGSGGELCRNIKCHGKSVITSFRGRRKNRVTAAVCCGNFIF